MGRSNPDALTTSFLHVSQYQEGSLSLRVICRGAVSEKKQSPGALALPFPPYGGVPASIQVAHQHLSAAPGALFCRRGPFRRATTLRPYGVFRCGIFHSRRLIFIPICGLLPGLTVPGVVTFLPEGHVSPPVSFSGLLPSPVPPAPSTGGHSPRRSWGHTGMLSASLQTASSFHTPGNTRPV